MINLPFKFPPIKLALKYTIMSLYIVNLSNWYQSEFLTPKFDYFDFVSIPVVICLNPSESVWISPSPQLVSAVSWSLQMHSVSHSPPNTDCPSVSDISFTTPPICLWSAPSPPVLASPSPLPLSPCFPAVLSPFHSSPNCTLTSASPLVNWIWFLLIPSAFQPASPPPLTFEPFGPCSFKLQLPSDFPALLSRLTRALSGGRTCPSNDGFLLFVASIPHAHFIFYLIACFPCRFAILLI